jgi:hypothetical protein
MAFWKLDRLGEFNVGGVQRGQRREQQGGEECEGVFHGQHDESLSARV